MQINRIPPEVRLNILQQIPKNKHLYIIFDKYAVFANNEDEVGNYLQQNFNKFWPEIDNALHDLFLNNYQDQSNLSDEYYNHNFYQKFHAVKQNMESITPKKLFQLLSFNQLVDANGIGYNFGITKINQVNII